MAKNKQIKGRLQNKHDIEVNWQKAINFIPIKGETIVYDIEVDSDGNILTLPEGRNYAYTYERYKIGDGVTRVNDLPFVGTTRGNELAAVEEGVDTQAGCRGYYFDAVQFVTDSGTDSYVICRLTKNQVTDSSKIIVTEEDIRRLENNEVDRPVWNWDGDSLFVNIVNNAKYYQCPVTETGSFPTGDSYLAIVVPFTSIALKSADDMDIDDFSITCPSYSNIGYSLIKKGAHAEGWSTESAGDASHAEGHLTKAYGDYAHAEGWQSLAWDHGAHAEGEQTQALAKVAHSEGFKTKATAIAAHSEGYNSEATGINAHAEGWGVVANSRSTHAEGTNTWAGYPLTDDGMGNIIIDPSAEANIATDPNYYFHSHAEGYGSEAYRQCAHAEGHTTLAKGVAAHSEGRQTTASGDYTHAEGRESAATKDYSHAEGYKAIASNIAAHAEGDSTKAKGDASHAEGFQTIASGKNTHAEGGETKASGLDSHAEGYNTQSAAEATHAEGRGTKALNNNAHAEGRDTTATGFASHVEGRNSVTGGDYQENTLTAADESKSVAGANAHAEGNATLATGFNAHSEGKKTFAQGNNSHAEGYSTHASGEEAHAEGWDTSANGKCSHAQGTFSVASGENSFAGGHKTQAIGRNSFAGGAGYYRLADAGETVTLPVDETNTEASGENSFAFGCGVIASERNSTAFGAKTCASGVNSFAMGYGTNAQGGNSLAHGQESVASGLNSTALGNKSIASGDNSFAGGTYHEGEGAIITNTTAASLGAFAYGQGAQALGNNSHAEGYMTTANMHANHAEGWRTVTGAKGFKINNVDVENKIYTLSSTEGLEVGQRVAVYVQHTEDSGAAKIIEINGNEVTVDLLPADIQSNMSDWNYWHAYLRVIGDPTIGDRYFGGAAHAEGEHAEAWGLDSHAEGYWSQAQGDVAHAEGHYTVAQGYASHAEGNTTYAIDSRSHAEGYKTIAAGPSTHAEGTLNVAGAPCNEFGIPTDEAIANIKEDWNYYAHAHAEGYKTKAIRQMAHAEGMATTASGIASHAGGDGSHASGKNAFAHGQNVRAFSDNQFAVGQWNKENNNALFVVGNGTDEQTRKNAFEVLKDGTVKVNGEELSNKPINYEFQVGKGASMQPVIQLGPSISYDLEYPLPLGEEKYEYIEDPETGSWVNVHNFYPNADFGNLAKDLQQAKYAYIAIKGHYCYTSYDGIIKQEPFKGMSFESMNNQPVGHPTNTLHIYDHISGSDYESDSDWSLSISTDLLTVVQDMLNQEASVYLVFYIYK